ncbi:hypothetical protein ACOSQ3_031583 [Xanthoceras sorbifolium]
MAYYSKIAIILILVTIFYVPCLQGRKVLNVTKMKGPLGLHNLVPSILHNIPTPTATPKSFQMAQSGQRLVTLHNARIMFSAPSPGEGN